MSKENTNSMQVDLTQSPDDFLKLANGEATPEDLKKPEQKEEPASKESAAKDSPVKTEEQPKDNVEGTTDEPKPSEQKPDDKQTPEGEVKPKLSAEEYQKREASKMIQRQSEERKRAMAAHIASVKANPDNLNHLIQVDAKLADEVVKEVYGYSGVEELRERSKLAELKESDPESGELAERIYKLESEAKIAKQEARKQAEKAYLESQGVMVSEFDPTYNRVQENLKKLNPSFVESDLGEAIKLAYQMTLGVKAETPTELEQAVSKDSTVSVPSGTVKSDSPKPTIQEHSSHVTGFADMVGAKLN